ncbi:hypothetical protein MBM_06768 [Drepanopeziza brunnea f. sp. 'multigermtubi' MB_m1]|uniref:Uncharacterized protein n=1 Tax=Marssonina brunnea f. sp. multigermtubi (strain MB_m1) TaxID=1072389 RepID=K1WRG8_MARBU|nr:uncharacterized protein MBM_06768 [Drepanopeziza brunnea f. sp. 'multigermtubi' MB_m1]EKD15007.1 hypothetical protein MBM_06768 [Drepanopeziza brunnea f. sp. 'multigermtubi' MB_m1]
MCQKILFTHICDHEDQTLPMLCPLAIEQLSSMFIKSLTHKTYQEANESLKTHLESLSHPIETTWIHLSHLCSTCLGNDQSPSDCVYPCRAREVEPDSGEQLQSIQPNTSSASQPKKHAASPSTHDYRMLLPRKRGFHQPQASPSSELQLANPEPLPSTYDSSITARRSFDSRLAVNPYRAREEDEPKTHSQPQASSSTSTSLQPSHLVPLPSTYIGSASARASSGSHRATTALPVSHSVLREYREELIGGRLEIVAHYHNPPAGWNAQHGYDSGPLPPR